MLLRQNYGKPFQGFQICYKLHLLHEKLTICIKPEKLSPFYKHQISAYKSQLLNNFGRNQLQNNISVWPELGNRHNQC